MFRDMLLPIDLSDESSWRKALPVALEYGRQFGSRLHFLTVMPDFRMPIVAQFFPQDFEEKNRRELRRQLHEFVAQKVPTGVAVGHVIVADGCAYEKILQAAEDMNIDLIVLASHRPAHRDLLLGSNAEQVVRRFRRSVLVVRE